MRVHQVVGPTWKPRVKDIAVLVNTSGKSLTIELPTGCFRLEPGCRRMIDARALNLESVKRLLEAGEIQWEPYRRGGR
ncbi:MAG: hypothetical protein J7M34_03730 [Anaerolineae bacterium]|nr:hypothetical protein [Anaerolineae bacterium]